MSFLCYTDTEAKQKISNFYIKMSSVGSIFLEIYSMRKNSIFITKYTIHYRSQWFYCPVYQNGLFPKWSITFTEFKESDKSLMHESGFIRGFPKIDHSGIDARIVFEQNKFSKTKDYLWQDLNSRPSDCLCCSLFSFITYPWARSSLLGRLRLQWSLYSHALLIFGCDGTERI